MPNAQHQNCVSCRRSQTGAAALAESRVGVVARAAGCTLILASRKGSPRICSGTCYVRRGPLRSASRQMRGPLRSAKTFVDLTLDLLAVARAGVELPQNRRRPDA